MENWKKNVIIGIFDMEQGGWKDGMDHNLEFLKMFGPTCCVCRNYPIPEGGICPRCWEGDPPCVDCSVEKPLNQDEIPLNFVFDK